MKKQTTLIQICHGHKAPFLEVAKFYAIALKSRAQRLKTIFIKDPPIENAPSALNCDAVEFYETPTRKLRGLKLGLIRRLRESIVPEKPAFIVAHRFKSFYMALLATLFTDIPVIGVIHAHDVFKRSYRRLFVRIFKKRLHIAAVSEGIAANIAQDLSGIVPIATLYNCIDVPKLEHQQVSKSQARQHLQLDPDAYIIGSCGRLHSDKDPLTLIRAFNRLKDDIPDSQLVIIGSGKLEKRCRDLVEALNLTKRVKLLGQIPNASHYFEAFDVFALASTLEPFGLVFLEAMAARIPVITTPTDGGLEVVANDAQLFKIGDDEACARKLLALYHSSPEHIQKITDDAYARLLEHFSQQAFTQAFWRHYEALLTR